MARTMAQELLAAIPDVRTDEGHISAFIGLRVLKCIKMVKISSLLFYIFTAQNNNL